MIRIGTIFALFIIPLFSIAQFNFEDAEIDLGFYADVVVNAQEPKHRVRAHDIFYDKLSSVLQEENSFNYDFEGLQWISIQRAPDNSFRFISWQLLGPENHYTYYGFYQDAKQTLELQNTLEYDRRLEYADVDIENWYGQLLYDIVAIDDYFLLFGFKQIDQFTKTKVVEVMRLADGNPVFGAPVFSDAESSYKENKKRLAIQYSADVVANLNYNPGLNMIVFDNLIERMGRIPGQGATLLPDGTYKAYKYGIDEWSYVDHLYDEINDEKPREGTKSEKRDLFGKAKN